MNPRVNRFVFGMWIIVLLAVLPRLVDAQGADDRLVVAVGIPGAHELYTLKPDGTDRKKVSSKGDNADPNWSPDRRKIAFSATRDGVTEIYVVNADGTGEIQVTKNNGTANIAPGWSPDGRYLVFVSNRSGKNDIYYAAADGKGDVHQLTQERNADYDTPAWSPDGKAIAFASNKTGQYELWTMDTAGANLRQLTRHKEGDYTYPAWTPDGKKIAFASVENGNGTVLSIGSGGGAPDLIADLPEQFVGSVTWSRDAKSIAFMVWKSTGNRSIQLVSLVDGSARSLTENGKDIGWASWSGPAKVEAIALSTGASSGATDEDESPIFNPETDTPAKTRRICSRSPLSRLDVGKRGRVTLVPPDPSDMRASPGSRTIVATMPAGAIFKIVEGPNCTSNLTWWRVTWRGVTGWTPEGSGSTYWLEPIPNE